MSLFVTFEGGEGSGKSTALRLIAERLNKEGHETVITREGSTWSKRCGRPSKEGPSFFATAI